MPTRREVNDLAAMAVGLIVDRDKAAMRTGLDPYGGLETATTIYDIDGERYLRVGTMQDWSGKEKRPDFHVVINEDYEEDDDMFRAKETEYDFHPVGLLRPNHSVRVQESVVFLDEKGLLSRWIPIAGKPALMSLRNTKMDRKLKRTLKEAVDIKFDRARFDGLKEMLEACGVENRIWVEGEYNEE